MHGLSAYAVDNPLPQHTCSCNFNSDTLVNALSQNSQPYGCISSTPKLYGTLTGSMVSLFGGVSSISGAVESVDRGDSDLLLSSFHEAEPEKHKCKGLCQ